MKFPSKLFLVFAVAFSLAAAILFGASLRGVRHAFGQMESERASAALELARYELSSHGEDVDHRIGMIAEGEATLRMAIDLNRLQPDYSIYANDARGVAGTQGLEVLEFVANDGTIVSSFHNPSSVGQKNGWIRAASSRDTPGGFLARVETSEGPAIAQLAVRAIPVGDKKLFLAGGRRLDHRFLRSLVLSGGMTAQIFLSLDPASKADSLFDATGLLSPSGAQAALVEEVRRKPESAASRKPFPEASAAVTYYAQPFLAPDGTVLSVVILGHSSESRQAVEKILVRSALLIGAAGILLAWLVSVWSATRITIPLERLARTAREIAAGSSGARADDSSGGEIAVIARALNETAERLASERERLLQAERVASWREMARRVALEMDPAVRGLENASQSGAFREAFERLQRTQERYREFGDLFVLPLQSVRLNDIVRAVVRDFEPLFGNAASDITRPPIHPEVYLAEDLPGVQGDPALLTRAVDSLVLFAVHSMPTGGTLTLRTAPVAGHARVEIEWLGTAPVPEEGERLFTPAGLQRSYATGLEMATVQTIISDHGGSASILSGGGQTRIWLLLPAEAAVAENRELAREPQAVGKN